MKDEDIQKLRDIIDVVKEQPWLLHEPRVNFFKTFIEDLGGKIPPPPGGKNEKTKSSEPEVKEEVKVEPESEESDIELDMTGVIGITTRLYRPFLSYFLDFFVLDLIIFS